MNDAEEFAEEVITITEKPKENKKIVKRVIRVILIVLGLVVCFLGYVNLMDRRMDKGGLRYFDFTSGNDVLAETEAEDWMEEYIEANKDMFFNGDSSLETTFDQFYYKGEELDKITNELLGVGNIEKAYHIVMDVSPGSIQYEYLLYWADEEWNTIKIK